MAREIQLLGSWGAIDVLSGQVIDKTETYKRDPGTTRDPVPILCRKLKHLCLAGDADAIHVTRDGMSVFKKDLPLSWWAERDCVESRNKSIRWIWYKPFDAEISDTVHARGVDRERLL